MPVGTQATVKGCRPDDSRAVGARVILANTYHLYFRPGAELVAAHGGLHGFMGWDGPILTDSGGFQVFSLRRHARRSTTTASTSRSLYDGSRHVSRPSRRSRSRSGWAPTSSCASTSARRRTLPRAQIERRRRRTTRWAGACAKRSVATTSCSSASSRAASTSRCAAAPPPNCWALDFAGLRDRRPVGGRARRRHACDRRAARRRCCPMTGSLLHGHRRPGRDPRRDRARRRHVRLRAADPHGAHRARRSRRRSRQPAQRALRRRPAAARRRLRLLRCCRTFTRAYLRHLVNQKEILGRNCSASTTCAF